MTIPALSAELHRSPVAEHVRAGVRMFRVTQDGTYAGRRYRAGEIVLVEGAPRDGRHVVMVPAGHGEPQLGRVQGALLLGSYGEPCSNARWRVAGRLVGVARASGADWTFRWFDGTEPARPTLAAPVPMPQPAVQPMAQLCLFAA